MRRILGIIRELPAAIIYLYKKRKYEKAVLDNIFKRRKMKG